MKQIKKTIIPNDFSAKSLLLLRKFIESSKEEKLDIVLLHGIVLPDSISELLFFRKSRYLNELCTKDFDDACVLIKNKFQSRINSLYLDIITSGNGSYFRNYIEANGIDEVCLPQGSKLDFKGKRSFNIIPLLKRSSLPVVPITLQVHSEMDLVQAGQIPALFQSGFEGKIS